MSSLNMTDDLLSERLASALPASAGFHFYHISTPPTRSPALYSAPPGFRAEKTYLESQFLNVTIRKGDGEIFILAIEALIYTTSHLTTIFVSKADSTGYLGLLKLGKGYASPLRTIATTFLGYLVEKRQRRGVKLVLSLFARASNQYLFPGSVENKSKHVSDDRQLVKWWCRVLDPVLRNYRSTDEALADTDPGDQATSSSAYLIVPGEDSILSYLPQDMRLNPSLRKRWKHGHPLREISRHPTAPPRSLVPHFPDDPKARFLSELDEELPEATTSSSQVTESPSKQRGSGQWRSVRSIEQFWEMMAFRQECSSGRLVGFIWLVFESPKPPGELHDIADSQVSQASSASLNSERDHLKSPSKSCLPSSSPRKRHTARRKKALRGPIVPRLPKIKSASSDLSSMTKSLPESSKYFLWPSSSRGELVLNTKDYNKATERLLVLQFRSEEAAVASTRTWVDEVGILAGKGDGNWGWAVIGRKEPEVVEVPKAVEGANVLGVKRKAETAHEADSKSNGATVNTLGSGLVKKKPKKIQPQLVG